MGADKNLLHLRQRLNRDYHGAMRHANSSLLFFRAGPMAGFGTAAGKAGALQIRRESSAAEKHWISPAQVLGGGAKPKAGSSRTEDGPGEFRVCRGIAHTALGRRCVRREQRSLVKSIHHPIGREIPRKFSLDFHRKRGPNPTIIRQQANPAGTCVLSQVKGETARDSISSVSTGMKPG